MQQQPNGLSPWQAWSLDVQMKLKNQQACISMLEQKLAAVCDQLKALENKPTYNIESLEYHFDQLKVEKLDGTLNIGMTPPGTSPPNGDIEQLAVSKPEVYPSAAPGIIQPGAPYADIQSELYQYLDNQAPQKLMNLEAQYNMPLDPYHRKMIIEDIRRQMPTRINYYMKSLQGDGAAGDQLSSPSYKADVIAKTERDADTAMMQYIQQLQNGNPA